MTEEKSPYTGPEQRKVFRRQKVDRRDDIRFEPSKEDRRRNSGRRHDDGDVWAPHVDNDT